MDKLRKAAPLRQRIAWWLYWHCSKAGREELRRHKHWADRDGNNR